MIDMFIRQSTHLAEALTRADIVDCNGIRW